MVLTDEKKTNFKEYLDSTTLTELDGEVCDDNTERKVAPVTYDGVTQNICIPFYDDDIIKFLESANPADIADAADTTAQEGTDEISAAALEALCVTLEQKTAATNQMANDIATRTAQLQNNLNDSDALLTTYTTDINSKMNLIATKDRMLQLSQDRNVYKKKVIYVLFSVLIAIFIAIISFYSIYNKNK